MLYSIVLCRFSVAVVNQKPDIFRNWLGVTLKPLAVSQAKQWCYYLHLINKLIKAIAADRRKAIILGFWQKIIRRYTLDPKPWSSAYPVSLLANIASKLKSYRLLIPISL